ncbi:hypothetical protein DOY81_013672, partial [Sarcophaga bullata]
ALFILKILWQEKIRKYSRNRRTKEVYLWIEGLQMQCHQMRADNCACDQQCKCPCKTGSKDNCCKK